MIKPNKSTSGAELPSSVNALSQKIQAADTLDASETKSFVMFTDENENENEDAFEKSQVENDEILSTPHKSEGIESINK